MVLELIYTISVFFCFFTAAIIYFKINKNKIYTAHLFTWYLILNGISNLFLLLVSNGLLAKVPYLYKIFAPFVLLIMPLAYLYIRGTLYNEITFKKIDLIHLFPFVVFTVNYLQFFFMPYEEKVVIVNIVVEDPVNAFVMQNGLLPEWVYLLSRGVLFIIYLSLIWVLLKRFYKHNDSVNAHFLKTKRWLYNFFNLQFLYWIGLNVLFVLLGWQFNKSLELDNLLNFTVGLIVSIFFFVISGYLLMNPRLLLGMNSKIDSIDSKQAEVDFKKIHQCFFYDKLYINPKLTVADISSHIELSTKKIGIAVVDQGYVNIYDYMNSVRLSEVKNAMENKLINFSIEGIAMGCGFNSNSTFYRAFKKKYNTTPASFLNKNAKPL
jgi:AraC-like DNA-binding protein